MNDIELKNYFNLIGKNYYINECSSLFLTSFLRKKLVSKIKNYKNKSIVDLMSGRGENLKYLKKTNQVTTVDFSIEMNKIAKESFKNINLVQIEGDFFDVIFSDNDYDIVLCSFGIKTIKKEDLKLFAIKINSILKNNGDILLLELVKPKNKFFNAFINLYTQKIIPALFGELFKELTPFIQNHTNMDELKNELSNLHLNIIEHKRYFDLFEIIHAKKIQNE